MPSTTEQDIRDWIDEAKPEHTHLIIVCDSFSYEDYPVYVSKGQSVSEVRAKYSGRNMQRVMEVIELSRTSEGRNEKGS